MSRTSETPETPRPRNIRDQIVSDFRDWVVRQRDAANAAYGRCNDKRKKPRLWDQFLLMAGVLAEFDRRVFDAVFAATPSTAAALRESPSTLTEHQIIEQAALRYHKAEDGTGEGEYGCPGLECPGVKRLIALLESTVAALRESPQEPQESTRVHQSHEDWRKANPEKWHKQVEESGMPAESLRVLSEAYGFTVDVHGTLNGLTRGDMGYEETAFKLIDQSPAPPQGQDPPRCPDCGSRDPLRFLLVWTGQDSVACCNDWHQANAASVSHIAAPAEPVAPATSDKPLLAWLDEQIASCERELNSRFNDGQTKRLMAARHSAFCTTLNFILDPLPSSTSASAQDGK